MVNTRDCQKQCYEMTHTINRTSKFITHTRQPNTTKSSLQNSRLRFRRPGNKSKKPSGDLNTDGFTSISGSLVKDRHLNPCFRLCTFATVGLFCDKLPLLPAQVLQLFDNWAIQTYRSPHFVFAKHLCGVGVEARNVQDLFGYFIVTLTMETRSQSLGGSFCCGHLNAPLSLGLNIHPRFLL